MSEKAQATQASEPLVRIEGLTKTFATGDGSLNVLDNLDFEVGAGERIAVVGQSGVGKSTFLHILGTLDHPTHGKVYFRGEDAFSEEMDLWTESNGVTFSMGTLQQTVVLAKQAGFIEVKSRDRNDWYCGYARDELERIKGPLWGQYVELFGQEDAGACVEGAQLRMLAAEQGHLRPGHIRGRRPF